MSGQLQVWIRRKGDPLQTLPRPMEINSLISSASLNAPIVAKNTSAANRSEVVCASQIIVPLKSLPLCNPPIQPTKKDPPNSHHPLACNP